MVNWNSVVTKTTKKNVVSFVESKLSLKDFVSSLDTTARKEFSKIRSRGESECQRLARKALRRRSIKYRLTSV